MSFILLRNGFETDFLVYDDSVRTIDLFSGVAISRDSQHFLRGVHTHVPGMTCFTACIAYVDE